MTEIKVEKDKGGIPWWVWALLAALIVAALLWWLLDDDDEAEAVREPVAAEMVAPAVPVAPVAIAPVDGVAANQAAGNQMAASTTSGPITDASMLYGGMDQAMVGRSVQLSGVRVLEVVGDAGFWIGDNQQRRAFAILNEQRTPNTSTEGRVDVNAGQTLTLNGTVRSGTEALRNLATGTTVTLPQGVERYVVVDQVQIRS